MGESESKELTPGLWKVEEVKTQVGRCYKILPVSVDVDDGHRAIACLYDDDTSLNPYPEGQQKANADLIIHAVNCYDREAPLLEALKELVELQHRICVEGNSAVSLEEWGNAWTEARSAIANHEEAAP